MLYPLHRIPRLRNFKFNPDTFLKDKEAQNEAMKQWDRLIALTRDHGFMEAVLENRRHQERIRQHLALL